MLDKLPKIWYNKNVPRENKKIKIERGNDYD
jgi:hypothetical protein